MLSCEWISESMPSKWWLIPNLAQAKTEDDLFEATVRLSNQTCHFILLSHLHLPFMLHQSARPKRGFCEYSRIACVNASQDLLHRYIAIRIAGSVSCCGHGMDFFAITASMTLILAHLDARCAGTDTDNALIHQRTSDRAMMEEILDNMEQAGLLSEAKTISEQGAGVLRRLLAIEADAAQGAGYRLDVGGDQSSDVQTLRLGVPYFSIITVSRDIKKYNPLAKISAMPSLPCPRTETHDGDVGNLSLRADQGGNLDSRGQVLPADLSCEQAIASAPIEGQESWTSQDVVFFDNIMRYPDGSVGNYDNYWWLP